MICVFGKSAARPAASARCHQGVCKSKRKPSGANFAKPVTTQNYIGNFTKKIIGMGAAQRYEMLGDNYVADVDAGPQPGAADQIVGLAGNEAFYGLGGDDATLGRAGDDYIDGGDVLQGAMHAARWKVCSRGRALGAAPTRSVA